MTVANQQDQLAAVQAQLTELQAKRRLDLNLCHVRAAGMGAEIQKLEARLQVPALEKIRDRVLVRFAPRKRKDIKKAIDRFISECALDK
jgi:hypothetical protein